MKTLIVYSSIHHGNTGKIGKVIAGSLNADLVKASDLNSDKLNDYDLIGFGSGVYKGKFHKSILDLIENMIPLHNKKAFVFSTSGMGKEQYNNPIMQKLKEKEFEVVGSFACKGYDTFGPFKLIGGIAKDRPNEEDIQNAKVFAQSMEAYGR